MAEVFVTKVTLGSKKIVLLREPKIRDQELAAQAASAIVGAEANPIALAMVMQREMLKNLIVQVDEKKVKPSELENLDDVFSYPEYTQLSQVIQKLTGIGADQGNVKTELTKYGS